MKNLYNNLDSYFNINKFSLKDKYTDIYNKNIDECAYYSIMNNNVGFSYKGNNDKCYLYKTQKMNNKLNDDDLNSYNIKTLLRKNEDINLSENSSKNYFNEVNNKYYNIDDIIDKVNVKNENECLEKCLDYSYGKCQSVIYLEEPKKCTFYKNKDIKLYNENREKIYTLKNNINKENAIKDIKNNIVYNYTMNLPKYNEDKELFSETLVKENSNIYANWTKIRDNPILYNCNGLNSTNPFCTKEYDPNNVENNELQYYTDCLNKQFDNSSEQEKYYSNECRKVYGDEYVFDDNYLNLDTVIKCDIGNKVKCKIDMYNNNIIENYDNGDKCTVYKNDRVLYEDYIENKDIQKRWFILLLFLFIIVIIFILCK
jgi:hypothetical protein